MAQQISRRGFVKSSLLASAVVPLGLSGATRSPVQTPAPPSPETLPTGKMGGQDFSRLILGGNLIGGWSHSRDLSYVSTLMRRYNTDAKIRETLELAEAQGITTINTWVMQENSHLFNHWKRGGKMKWIAQVRLDAGGGYSQIQKAIDEGAAGIHLTGDTAESLLTEGRFEKVGETVELIKSKKRVAGVAAHDLRVIVECEKAKLDVDFYQKTFHSHDYFTAPRPGEKDPGRSRQLLVQRPAGGHRLHGERQEALDRLQDSGGWRHPAPRRFPLHVQPRRRLHPRRHVRLADRGRR